MTSQSREYISRISLLLNCLMTREIHVILYSENNIYSLGHISFTFVNSHMTDIVSIYLGSLHSYIICISRMKYITWHKKNKKSSN